MSVVDNFFFFAPLRLCVTIYSLAKAQSRKEFYYPLLF